MLLRLAPIVFVVLWSSGWLVAGVTAQNGVDPLTFLAVRFGAAILLIAPLLAVLGVTLPRDGAFLMHAVVTGLTIHAFYLGAVWWAVGQGVPAGLSALLAGLQPLLTAILGVVLLGERLAMRQWAGVFVGFAGILLVLWPRLAAVETGALGAVVLPLAINFLGMLSVTLGTFYQKKFLPTTDLVALTAVQYVVAFAFMLPLAWLLEPMRLVWNPAMVAVLLWSVIALSFGGIGAFFWLIRRGEVARAAAFIYLVPAVAALQAWALLGETLTTPQIAGMVVAAFGVALVAGRAGVTPRGGAASGPRDR